jgi:hypothetical protein
MRRGREAALLRLWPSLPLLLIVPAVSCGPPAGTETDAGPGDAGAVEAAADVNPPRPIGPISVSFANTRRPTFRWKLAEGSDGARVEVCRDRACMAIVAAFAASGEQGAPPSDLPFGAVFWRLHGMAGGAVGATSSATWELVVPRVSVAAREEIWGAMLDANGDGYADVVAGDSDAFNPTQHVYVHHGGAGGPSAVPSSVLSATAPVVAYAASIASAGDLDGDGFGDLLVGSPKENLVYVYRGGPSGFASPPALLRGPMASDFGGAVAAAGDVDGDGYGDAIVGMPILAPEAGVSPSGAAVVVYGSASGLSLARSARLAQHAGSSASSFGQYVSSAGDADGDGRPDVAVWGGIESTDPQEVELYLVRDPHFGAAPSARLKFDGSPVSWLGDANLLAWAGDVNGDGFSDLVMSSTSPPNLGADQDHLSLFFGSPPGPAADPSQRVDNPFGTTANFGLSVAALDVDGDGFEDVAAAAAWIGAPPGPSAVVYRGGPSGLGGPTVIQSADLSGIFEREVASVGDIDGDGYADLLVGAPSRATPVDGGALHGAVDVYPGGAAGVATTPRWTLLPPDSTTVAYGAALPGP